MRASRSASAALCIASPSSASGAMRVSSRVNLLSSARSSRLTMSRRSFFAGVGGGSPGGRGFRPGLSFLVPTSRTQPPAFMCFLIEVVLVPRATAIRANDKSPWTTSCLMASQSGSAFCVSSEMCGGLDTFPLPSWERVACASIACASRVRGKTQFAFGVAGVLPQGTAEMVQLL